MVNNTDRLEFLVKKFNVVDLSDKTLTDDLSNEYFDKGYQNMSLVEGHGDKPIAYVFTKESIKINNSGGEVHKIKYAIYIGKDVFDAMVLADPTKNKIYTQWMLNVFNNLIKSGEESEAVRFVDEDLPQAEEYLTLFESHKRKKKFKEYCKVSYVLKNVTDPTNINQYHSLSQLYDAVDPFIERDPSDIEKTMLKFVSMGQAEIPVKDRRFTVFIPKTTEANVVFNKYASWCTVRPGNGMFDSYTQNNLKPNGKVSDIYIVIDHRFYEGENDNNLIHQIHFESKQVRNRNQSGESFYEDVISQSEGVANFFNSELTQMAKDKFTIEKNVYLDYLVKFGWTQAMFDLMNEVTPVIKFINREVPKLADVSRFKELRQLIICKSKLHELHPSLGKLTQLESLSLAQNKLKSLPREIGNLKNLNFINLIGNPIKDIPNEIKYLDKSNGGSLVRIAVKESDIGQKNYKKLKGLLPSTLM